MSSSKILKIVAIAVVVILVGWFVNSKGLISSPQKVKVVGVLYVRQHLDAYGGLKSKMSKLGYSDKNLIFDEVEIIPGPNIDKDSADGARKLLADNVDLLFISAEQQAIIALKVMKEINSTIPVVFMTRFHDPIDYKLIDSYKSSGNNTTGVATNLVEVVQKNLQFFKDINPKAAKVGVFGEGFMIPNVGEVYLAELKKQAPRFGMTIVEYTKKFPPDGTGKIWHEIADNIKPGEIDALFHIAGHFYNPQEAKEGELATRLHIPLAVPSEDFPNGGTFSYSDDFAASAGQAAVMIDKIFKGKKPSDIPIEFGAKSALILNLKRAAEAGFTFPDSMLNIATLKTDK